MPTVVIVYALIANDEKEIITTRTNPQVTFLQTGSKLGQFQTKTK